MSLPESSLPATRRSYGTVSTRTPNTVTFERGPTGKSAYEIAVEQGFVGTEEEWAAKMVPIVVLSQVEFDALPSRTAGTLYVVLGE